MTSEKQVTPLEDERCEVRTIHLDRINRARTEAIGEQELQWMAQIYKVLGDPTRLKILLALRGDEMCVCDLAAFLCLTESAVSHQLRRLKDLGLVKNRRDGQILYYSLNDDHVAELIRVGLEHLRE